LPISFRIALCILLVAATGLLRAQTPQPRRVDLSVTYAGERSLRSNTSENFWMQGGSIELGVDAWRGWGIALDATGVHTGSSGAAACRCRW